MKANLILWLITSSFFGLFGCNALAGDTTCYGYKSTTSYFSCNIDPYNSGNCTWWAAHKRPDLAAARSGSGWNGGQWYDKFKNFGFPVGSVPKAGAIVEFSKPGHVAYVEKEGSDGSFYASEMDAYNSDGFVDGVNYATYSPNGDGTYRRNNGSQKWTLKGFIYQKEFCNPSKERCTMRTSGSIGWYPPVSSCQEATQWFKLIRDTTNQVSRIEPATKNECPLACFKTN